MYCKWLVSVFMLMITVDVVVWIKTEGGRFSIDTNRIAVAGGSAGGYLALSTGFNPQSTPDAIIDISAPTGFSMEGIRFARRLHDPYGFVTLSR